MNAALPQERMYEDTKKRMTSYDETRMLDGWFNQANEKPEMRRMEEEEKSQSTRWLGNDFVFYSHRAAIACTEKKHTPLPPSSLLSYLGAVGRPPERAGQRHSIAGTEAMGRDGPPCQPFITTSRAPPADPSQASRCAAGQHPASCPEKRAAPPEKVGDGREGEGFE